MIPIGDDATEPDLHLDAAVLHAVLPELDGRAVGYAGRDVLRRGEEGAQRRDELPLRRDQQPDARLRDEHRPRQGDGHVSQLRRQGSQQRMQWQKRRWSRYLHVIIAC